MKHKHTIKSGTATLAGRIPKGSENQIKAAPLESAEFTRLVKAGQRCPVSGLSRSGMIDLGNVVPGLLVRVRRPGCIRGAVLVSLPVLRSYLQGLQTAQAGVHVASYSPVQKCWHVESLADHVKSNARNLGADTLGDTAYCAVALAESREAASDAITVIEQAGKGVAA
jgi:hypothetical protein